MNEGLIPRRYAKALYEVAVERKSDSRLYQMMKTLEQSFSSNPKLGEVLSNPYISDSDKCGLLMTATGATDKDSLYRDFLKLLTENHRLDLSRDIAYAYVKIYRESNRIYPVKVVSAAPMTPDNEKRLKEMITKHLKGGQMEYDHAVDPELIGGFTVAVGNERIDASIKNELKQLRLNLITK